MNKITIDGRVVSENTRPYIIAELSANHGGSFKKAKNLIKKISKTGVDAIKLQTFLPDHMTLDLKKKDFIINDKTSLWFKYNLYHLYKKAMTNFEWHNALFKEAKKNKLTIFSSVFDEEAVNFLKKFNVPAYKIASFENNHYPLIKNVLKQNKATLISLGATNKSELSDLNKLLIKEKNKKIVLMKCTSIYPSPNSALNLKGIEKIKKMGYLAGFSDHTKGSIASICAVSLGACVVEKHVKDDNDFKSLDSDFSLPVSKLKNFVEQLNEAWDSIGQNKLTHDILETKSRIFKRSIYISKDIKKNEKLTIKNIKIIRPGFGLPTKYYSKVLGTKSKYNLKKGSRLKLSFIK